MAKNKHLESGILELYVAGALSEKENKQIYDLILAHPEILNEIKEIEKTISVLTSSVSPKEQESSFKNILIKMVQEREKTTSVISINKPKNNWITYTGWAASVIIGSALLFSVFNNKNINTKLSNDKQQFEKQLEKANSNLAENEKLLDIIRDKNITTVPLEGQKVAPNSYAKVYWNKNTKTVYLDVKGLPDPPKGKVYQLWSLKLNPLTPTSLGTIDNFITDTNKIFNIKNPNESQAFGITLEPAGGSKTPTLEQLYTLGAVSNS